MPRLFDCCKNCKPPKRRPSCHGTCPEYLADRAKYDELVEAERKQKSNDSYVISRTMKAKDSVANQRPNQYIRST